MHMSIFKEVIFSVNYVKNIDYFYNLDSHIAINSNKEYKKLLPPPQNHNESGNVQVLRPVTKISNPY